MNIENEKIKLTATYANGLAIAIFAVAGLGPLIAYFNTHEPNTLRFLGITVLTFASFGVSLRLHMIARKTLEDLKDE
jgi:hypothetical protein